MKKEIIDFNFKGFSLSDLSKLEEVGYKVIEIEKNKDVWDGIILFPDNNINIALMVLRQIICAPRAKSAG